MFELTDKVAVVAGGAGYLGLPVCQKLLEQGAKVVVADINREQADSAAGQISAAVSSGRAKGEFLDVSSEESIDRLISQTVTEFGGLDILVNATFASAGKLVEELTGAEFDATLHTNLTGAFNLARKAAGVMKPGSSIIFFSSMYGKVSPDPRIYASPMKPNPIEYGVAKAGIEQMVRYLAVHWAPRNIRVNAVLPGPFPNLAKEAYSRNPEAEAFARRLADRVPLGRVGRQEEMAGPVVFLASGEASYVTGHVLVVDGGWTIW